MAVHVAAGRPEMACSALADALHKRNRIILARREISEDDIDIREALWQISDRDVDRLAVAGIKGIKELYSLVETDYGQRKLRRIFGKEERYKYKHIMMQVHAWALFAVDPLVDVGIIGQLNEVVAERLLERGQ